MRGDEERLAILNVSIGHYLEASESLQSFFFRRQ